MQTRINSSQTGCNAQCDWALKTGAMMVFLSLGLALFGPRAFASLTPQDDAALTSASARP